MSLRDFLAGEWRELVATTTGQSRAQGDAPDEGALIKRAEEGQRARDFLESPIVRDFMTRCEAKLLDELTAAPLADDAGRRNLAVSVQTLRQLRKYLAAATQDGRMAERELARLRDTGRRKAFF